MVKPAVVFRSETWAVPEMDMKKLGTGEREILRRIYGQVVEREKCRIRTEQELRELYKKSVSKPTSKPGLLCLQIIVTNAIIRTFST